jgi:hypothetical protein
VLVFLDADCIPDPAYVETHMRHHRRADNLVVSSSRRHIDRRIEVDAVDDFPRLLAEAGAAREATGSVPPDDWRRVFFRRSQGGLLGDAAYRAATSGLMSVSRSRFEEVGGFDEAFRVWGGEDTELSWRLWNSGCFVVPALDSVVIHQRSEDLEGAEGREAGRAAILALVADRVPHRFYRGEASHLHSVPKVSVIATVADTDEADRAWREVSRATFGDTELVLVGTGAAVATRRALAGSPSVTIADDLDEGIRRASGEILLVVDGRSRFDRRLLARIVSRMDDRGSDALRVGYRVAGSRVLRLDDLARIDADHGRGSPFLVAIRRRAALMDRSQVAERAIEDALGRGRTELLVTDLVEVPIGGEAIRSSFPRFSDLRAAGATELARGARRLARPTPAHDNAPGAVPGAGRPQIAYIGLAGVQNLGDDAMLEAIRSLMPFADVTTAPDSASAVMLGGGTLFNAGGYYLNRIRRVDGPGNERIVFGTGMRDPDFFGITERVEEWLPFLETSTSVGVRGPRTEEHLRTWGYAGPLEVIGDPALALTRPPDVEVVPGRIIVCPVFTDGSCWGGDDAAVFAAFAETARSLIDGGHEVVLMTAHPTDDRWAIEIMRAAGRPDMPFVPGYADLGRTLDLIAGSSLVIGERLHAVVLAAAMDVPFVAVEYRPKLRDFAASIGAEEWCLRTDEVASLGPLVQARLTDDRTHTAEVAVFRASLAAAADGLAEVLGVDASPDD